MKVIHRLWFISLLILTVFMSGCGCGGQDPVALVSLVSIEVTTANPSIALGTSHQFTATGVYSDNSRQDITNSVTWSSSNSSIADVSNEAGSRGLAVAHAIGSVKITAISGSISGFTTLTVTNAELVSVSISPINSTLGIGTKQQFTAMGAFTDNTLQDITKSVTWSSSNNSVATISNAADKGLATTVAAGTATISATLGNIVGSASLTVTSTVTTAALVSIAVTPVNKTAQRQATLQYTATGSFSDNTTQDITKSVIWSSSNNSIASISNAADKGLATAVAAGTATISAKLGEISGSTSLTVTSVALVSIMITPRNTMLGANSSLQFTAMGTFSDDTKRDITTEVTWSSSNPSYVSISNNTGSNGVATRNSSMFFFVTITATLDNISDSTTLIDP